MKTFSLPVIVLCGLLVSGVTSSHAQSLPTVRIENGASQLLVHGQPFLMLGGELGNSSAGTAAQADSILPRLARLHFNTVLMPVAWDQIEPREGRFDFSTVDHWIAVARAQHLHLVLLWFGSWKNALSNYAPEWVLADPQRFPREISASGEPLEILSPLGTQTVKADGLAFAALMLHIRAEDSAQQTVLMVQVENEIGCLCLGGRDRSAAANRLFAGPVPAPLTAWLRAHPNALSPEFATHHNPAGQTWAQVFGSNADEAFMAWAYARFVNQVAEAGKRAYNLPMYMNAQLPAPFERAGEYPSGGPYPNDQAIYRAVVPAINFYAPDIYWPDFAHWVMLYKHNGNPAFVPEARLDEAPFNALYLYGQARGFGFSPFGVDSLPDDSVHAPMLAEEYKALGHMSGLILKAQQKNTIRALVLHADSPRPSQTVALGGFLFRTTLSRNWRTQHLQAQNGAMMVIETAPNTFYVMGSGLTVTFARDPDTDNQIAGIASIEQLTYANGQWRTALQLNGDQSNQGRELMMTPNAFHVYRVKIYTYPRIEVRKNAPAKR